MICFKCGSISFRILRNVKYILMMTGGRGVHHLESTCEAAVQAIPAPRSTPNDTKQHLTIKVNWKTIVTIKVTVYHEAELRLKAVRNSNLQYLNVQ